MSAESNETPEKLNTSRMAGVPFLADVYPSRYGWTAEKPREIVLPSQFQLRYPEFLVFDTTRRFRCWGAIFGAAALTISIGPKILFQVCELLGLVNSEDILLWNLWALLTLPFAVTVFLIGGIKDAGRILDWFHR